MTAKFWVGGTGTWDNATTTNWALSTGGAGGAAVPVTGDTVTFDASSGGGVVSVSATISGLSLVTITTGAFTGTLSFSSGNPNLTLSGSPGLACNGSGTHTINLGSGTFTISNGGGALVDFTNVNLTLNAGTSNIVFSSSSPGNSRTLNGGSKTLATFTVNPDGGGLFDVRISGTPTFGTLTLNGPCSLWPVGSFTVSTSFNVNGTASNATVGVWYLEAGSATITLNGTATINWAYIGGNLTFTGSPVANNSFNLGKTTGITVNGPSGGGSGTGAFPGSL